MIRVLASSFAVLAMLAASSCAAVETIPVVHNEPITLHILSGKTGRPLAYAHLILFAGYDQNEIRDRFFHEEAITDDQGRALLSNQMDNLPYLQVWVMKTKLCIANAKTSSFSVERIRRDGLSTPNRCGIVTVQDAPGSFTVFVESKNKPVKKTLLAAIPTHRAPVPVEPPAKPVEAPALVEKSLTAKASVPVPAPQLPSAVVTAPTLKTKAPVEAAPKNMLPALAPTTVIAVATPVRHVAKLPRKEVVHGRIRRTSIKKPRRRAKPVLAACPAPQPPAKRSMSAARVKAHSKIQPQKPLTATGKPSPVHPKEVNKPEPSAKPAEKPAAGTKPSAGTPEKSVSPAQKVN